MSSSIRPGGFYRRFKAARTGAKLADPSAESRVSEPVDQRHCQGCQDKQPRRREIGRVPWQVLSTGFLEFGKKPVADKCGCCEHRHQFEDFGYRRHVASDGSSGFWPSPGSLVRAVAVVNDEIVIDISDDSCIVKYCYAHREKALRSGEFPKWRAWRDSNPRPTD